MSVFGCYNIYIYLYFLTTLAPGQVQGSIQVIPRDVLPIGSGTELVNFLFSMGWEFPN